MWLIRLFINLLIHLIIKMGLSPLPLFHALSVSAKFYSLDLSSLCHLVTSAQLLLRSGPAVTTKGHIVIYFRIESVNIRGQIGL